MYFIGLDVHKKTISYCVKDAAGRVQPRGQDRINAPRTGRMDSDYAAAPHDRDGSDDLYRLDL